MKISVVIPMFNAARTIVSTVHSCLQQTLVPIEIIIVDDNSLDESCNIVTQNFEDQISLIRLETNLGPSAARNKGWDIAKGDYVAFLDSDDTWHPQKLEIFNKIIKEEKNIDLWWHLYTSEKIPSDLDMEKVNILSKTNISDLLKRNPVSSSAIILKRNIPIRFNEQMRYCEDYDLALRTSYRYQAFSSPILLTQIGRPVLSEGGASAQKWKMRKGELKTYFNLGKLNFGFYFLFPFLLFWSLIKHLRVIVLK
ncbi:MAG TPA: glycosyltransferase family 2 protein [Edaphocola sp.]|nr:glycosyltransferase family 2 protein [Edaphocola sp.]